MSGEERAAARPILAQRAVALRHDPHEGTAPEVVARGAGELARAMLELARAHDIPVQEDPDLLELLATCEPGTEIPVELYQPVAELLAFLHRLNGRARERFAGREATPRG